MTIGQIVRRDPFEKPLWEFPNLEPQVGMYMVGYFGSDKYPYIVIEVMTERKIKIQECDVQIHPSIKQPSDMPHIQWYYSIKTNPLNRIYEVSLRKNNKWHIVGQTMKGVPFTFGSPLYYLDPHK